MLNKKVISIVLSILLLSGFINVSPVSALSTGIETLRLAGDDRFATSVAISQAGWVQADTVILVTGFNYPDALAASALTKSNDAPILLTNTDTMSQIVIDEIVRLKATNAILVGGTGVIGTGVENQMKALGLSTSRISGSDRYDTSAKVAEMIGTSNGVIVATGQNFPDALSVAPIAAIKSIPILLSPPNSLDPYVSEFLSEKNIPASYVVGGTDVLSNSVAANLPNSKRLNSTDRYATNLSIINEFSGDLSFDTVYLATGLNFSDALSGSALAAKNSAPIILTGKDSIAEETISFIRSKNVKRVVILGGTNVVSSNVEDEINGIIHPSSISLSQTSLSLTSGETYTLTANVYPSNATNNSVTWTSSSPNASVDSSGRITALSAGIASITAKTADGNLSANCMIIISSINAAPATLSVNVKSFGAVGDGVKDDTSSIQNALNTGASVVVIPDGTYMINSLISLKPKSNQKIQMSENAVLKAIPTTSQNYSIIMIRNVSNVEIEGGMVLGERYEHTGTSGEWGFGIVVHAGTDNIRIRNVTSKNCWGDGIYIGSSSTAGEVSKNITIENVVCDNNRRQGMSITRAENITIRDCVFKNTNGTPPKSGIDIEPNNGCYVKNVVIENSSFLNNMGCGVQLYGGYGLYIDTVRVSNCFFSGNGVRNIYVGINSSNVSELNNSFE